MKSKEEIIELVCAPHCRFFKPGQKEELSCAAYDLFAERALPEMIARWRNLFRSDSPPSVFSHDPRVENAVCARCPFREEDCDFMAREAVPGSVPCGGYVLLVKLLDAAGPIERAEIEEMMK